jgi:U2 small nuclear ribonucleoprotein B''
LIKKIELRKALLAVFSHCGKVADIFASRRYKLRGQAWIIYGDSQSAATALQLLQGLPFYSKPMNIAVALKFPSTNIKKSENSSLKKLPRKVSEKSVHTSCISTPLKESGKDDGIGQGNTGEDRVHKNTLKSAILSIKGLPGFTPFIIQWLVFTLSSTEATTDQMLSLLFKQFPGFQSVQIDSEKPGLASVEFRSAAEATTALSGLQGFRLNSTHTMEIEYAKSAI